MRHRLIGPKNAVERKDTEIHSAFIEAHIALRTLLRYKGDEAGRETLNHNAHVKLNRLSKNIDELLKPKKVPFPARHYLQKDITD